MAGYSRQSAADIIANAVIKAAPVNAEYNAIRDAFALSGGHKHDGSSTEGAYVPLIADTDALNKVVVDTSNNRISFYSEVSSAAVEQLRIQDGAIVPVTDNDIDLGTSSLEFKDLYIDGVGYLDSVVITGGTIDGTVIGGTTPAAADFTTMDASGNVTVGGTFAVTGTSALTGTATITSADINSGAMDNTTIGGATPAAGTFTNLTASGTTTITTADINGGAIDGVTIGGSSAGAGTFTDLTASGTTTITTADINGGNIDGTTIGASSAAAGSFTTVSTSGQATLASVDVNGGNIDGTIIGASSPAAITGTTITGTSLVGTVTGNVTGNLTGNVTGNVTGDLTGNVTAGSGSSTFNNVTVNGTLDVTGTTIANVTDPSNAQDAATKNYVDTEVAALVDSAPGTLDTLNELAAALNDDPNFSTTITNSIATKLPLAGGTMSGAIAMGTNKITGLGDPTANQDAATKKYTTDTFLPLAGGTLTGAVVAGNNKITATYTPSANADLTTKTYVDGILGSATAAATSATAAASSATAAASSATAAASSATSAASSATSAAASYDSFDDRYLGAKSSAPTVDNDGDALVTGALYFNSSTNIMNVRTSGGAWTAAGSSVNGTSSRNTYTATAGQTTFSATYDSGYVDVYLNGVKLLSGTDFTATNGTSVVLASGAAVGDIVDIVAYGTFTLSDHYTKTQSDDRYLQLSGGTLTGGLTGTTATFSGDVTIADKIVHSGDTNTAIRFPAADTVTVETNGSEAFRIDSGGHALFTLATNAVGNFADNVGEVGSGNFCLQVSNTAQDALKPLGFRAEDIRFATGSAERVRIDSSGNFIVGKTTSTVGTAGTSIESTGRVEINADSTTPLSISRITDEGDMIQLYEGSTLRGKIGIEVNDLFITSANSGIRFDFNNTRVVPCTTTGAASDGTDDLGDPNARWKDIYLSGGVIADGVSQIASVEEKVTTSTSTSGTLTVDTQGNAVTFLTANQSANRTINFSNANSNMATGESMTFAVLATQGSTAYYLNAYQVDGSSVTPKWQGGSAPTAGNASGIDAYSFTIIKTADATFTVLASITQFA